MKCKVTMSLLVLWLLVTAGCATDSTGSCDDNQECLQGYLCDKNGKCVKVEQKDLQIAVESLTVGVLGEEYSFTLSAVGGLDPYGWSINTALGWLFVEENPQDGTCKLTGTPTAVVSEAAVELIVKDSTVGDGQSATKPLTLSVVFCTVDSDNTCSDHGTCSAGVSCICDSGYAGDRCDECAEGYQRNGQQECVRYEYRCYENKCGADAQWRECANDACSGVEWEIKQDCSENALCWSDQEDAGCIDCGAYECVSDKCKYCDTGPCCDNGEIRPNGYECDRWVEYRCSGSVCGANGENRELVKYCDGNTFECLDESQVVMDWTTIAEYDCDINQVCIFDGDTSLSCVPCGHDCADGACWPECNPVTTGCCSPQGRLIESCWYDQSTGLAWQNPSYSKRLNWNDAKAFCSNLTLGNIFSWRLPSISELRSLIQDCPATQASGSCSVTDPTCLEFTCWSTDCEGCEFRQGNGLSGCYWELECEGLCGDLWSCSAVEGSPSEAWSIDFRDSYVFANVRDYISYVRCVW